MNSFGPLSIMRSSRLHSGQSGRSSENLHSVGPENNMTKDQWLRNRLVAKYWCDRMREILQRSGSSRSRIEEPRQLSLKLVIPREEK
jgi:hypothetical protein